MYRKLFAFAALTCSLWAVSEESTPFRKCTEEIPSPLSVQINDCEVSPCVVFAGSRVNLTITFTAVNRTTETIQAEVVAYVNDDAFPFQMPNDFAEVCNHLDGNAHCPLNTGDTVTYSFTLPLDHSLPDVFVEVEIAMVDEANKSCVSCFVADIRVKAEKHHHEKD